LTYAGWLDAGTANGVLSQFAGLSNTQEDWIGPWSHGQGYFADPFQPSRLLTAAEHRQLQDVMFAFFDRYVKDGERPDRSRVQHYYTLNQGVWHTTTTSPVPGTRIRMLYFGARQVLFRPGDKIKITIAAADPDNFQLLPATGNAAYRISSTHVDPSFRPVCGGPDGTSASVVAGA
jgi:predicted acyl esterase